MSAGTATARLLESGSRERNLLACVLLSIALHSAVLGLFPPVPPAATRAVTVLTATLMPRVRAPEPEPPRPEPSRRPPAARLASAPAAAEPAPAKAEVQAEPVAEERRLPEPQAPVVARPAPEADASRVPDQSAAVAAVPPQSAEVAAPAPPRAREASLPAPPMPTLAPDPAEPRNLDQYRLALIGIAKKYRRYPAQAIEKGWTGKVEVRLVIGPGGAMQDALVKSSSGHDILDRQAIEMVRKALPLTPIPAALRGKEFSVDIPVIFDLQAG